MIYTIITSRSAEDVIKKWKKSNPKLFKKYKKSIMNWQITQEQYLVNSLQECRVLAYPQITEEFFETFLLITVIVRVEHTEKQAFSKTTGTDEEEIAASPALAKTSSYRHNIDSDSSPWRNQTLRMVLVLLAVSSCYEI